MARPDLVHEYLFHLKYVAKKSKSLVITYETEVLLDIKYI